MNELNEMPQVMEQIKSLRESVHQGDPSALPRLRAFLDEHPEVWHQLGDLGWHVRESLLEMAGGKDSTAVESIRRKMHELHEGLIGESTSPAVRLLAENCVICWVQLNVAELAKISRDLNGRPSDYDVQRRLNAIQGRYLRAIKTLMVVKRLLEPAAVANPKLKVIG
jgi:hypothetical protein